MLEVLAAASEMQAYCREKGWKHCFIGGIAVQRWASPRTTVDVDLTLLTGFGEEESFAEKLLERFKARVADPVGFAVANRVLLLQSSAGVGIDVAFGAMPFEESAVARASDFEFIPGLVLTTCSAEDLIVMKAFAGRKRDWSDVERVMMKHGQELDWKYIRKHARSLAEMIGAPEMPAELEKLRIEAERE